MRCGFKLAAYNFMICFYRKYQKHMFAVKFIIDLHILFSWLNRQKKVIPERKINVYKNRFLGFSEKGDNMTVTHEQYVVNENGEKVAIILPIEEYEKMKEDLHDLAIVAERRNEKTISLEEMKRKL